MTPMLDVKIPVLDQGFVVLRDLMGGDLDVARAARVSYDQDDKTGEDPARDEQLIRYLMTNHHTSPFEHVVFKFEVKAPILVFRQWLRHRTWSYNEVSARYATLDEGFYLPRADVIGKQSKSSKQARDVSSVLTEEDLAMAESAVYQMSESFKASQDAYHTLLAAGVPKELARAVLPVSAYSRLVATVDLHNLFHFLRLRLHSHAQWEIRQYAQAMLNILRAAVPVSCAAFEETLS